MRTRAWWRGSSGGRTKVVSDRLNSAAIACISRFRQPPRVGKHGQRVAPEAAVGEHVHGDELERRHAPSSVVRPDLYQRSFAPSHVRYPARRGRRIAACSSRLNLVTGSWQVPLTETCHEYAGINWSGTLRPRSYAFRRPGSESHNLWTSSPPPEPPVSKILFASLPNGKHLCTEATPQISIIRRLLASNKKSSSINVKAGPSRAPPLPIIVFCTVARF